jgi:thiamine kinase-like enzyme
MINLAVQEQKITNILVDFLQCHPNSVSITQLKDGIVNCYNNTDYKITVDGKRYFAKIANPNGKILMTSIENEVDCTTIAYKEGISPKILIYDLEQSILITEFIEAKEELNLKDSNAKKRWVDLLKRLHNLEVQFPLKFSPIDTIHHYLDRALERGVEMPSALIEEVLPKIDGFDREKLFLRSVPCHLDAGSGNILDDEKKLYLVDWECAAMCDPFFDLASMSAWEDFPDEEMFEVLALYLKRAPSEEDLKRIYQMRILADLRFGSYCYLQIKLSSTRNELYRKFAEGYFNQVMERITTL